MDLEFLESKSNNFEISYLVHFIHRRIQNSEFSYYYLNDLITRKLGFETLFQNYQNTLIASKLPHLTFKILSKLLKKQKYRKNLQTYQNTQKCAKIIK